MACGFESRSGHHYVQSRTSHVEASLPIGLDRRGVDFTVTMASSRYGHSRRAVVDRAHARRADGFCGVFPMEECVRGSSP